MACYVAFFAIETDLDLGGKIWPVKMACYVAVTICWNLAVKLLMKNCDCEFDCEIAYEKL